uniref:Uncharacterized protein n=1 Tax=Arundo donax TaxID=35708 RepID=A0A0A8XSM3_ARUDO
MQMWTIMCFRQFIVCLSRSLGVRGSNIVVCD